VIGSKAAVGGEATDNAAPAPIHLVQGGIRPGGAGTSGSRSAPSEPEAARRRSRGVGSSLGCGGAVAATAIGCLPRWVGGWLCWGWVERERTDEGAFYSRGAGLSGGGGPARTASGMCPMRQAAFFF
jgi:hypothetical protein